jgi:nitroimidazol reductase NimA-like FMN-containing flavoprotein (pyridoxamine 5'-phosphate oxidase superfamily)
MAPTERTTLKRVPERGSHERDTIAAIIDEAVFCHLGLVDPEGRPFVIPTIHARVGDHLYVHGSPASRALRTADNGGIDACVTITLLDGLVLARSAFHHSVNYRSVVVYGRAVKVEDREEKLAAFDAIVEHVVAGRSAGCRPANEKELKGTLVLRLPLDEASAKIRAAGVIDDEDDLRLDVWAGVVPITTVPGTPVADVGVDRAWPGYDLARPRATTRAGTR